jgi:hypothetical protein
MVLSAERLASVRMLQAEMKGSGTSAEVTTVIQARMVAAKKVEAAEVERGA